MKISEKCTESFFVALGTAVSSVNRREGNYKIEVGGYITSIAKSLYLHILIHSNFEILPQYVELEQYEICRYLADIYTSEWQRLMDLELKDYDPLYNKDLIEEEKTSGEDTLKRDDTSHASANSTFTRNDESSASSSTTYDSDSYVPTSKLVNEGGSTSEGSADTTLDRTDKTMYGKTTTFTSKGNIGVMSTQELYQLEINLRLTKHLEDMIIACIVDSMISGVFSDDT